jgi:hypothetical protein
MSGWNSIVAFTRNIHSITIAEDKQNLTANVNVFISGG